MAEGRTTESEAPTSFMGWAIASMVLCFLPLGAVSVAYALRSTAALQAGDAALAARRRRIARRWAIAALVVGIVLDLVILAVLLLLGAFGG